MAKPYKIIATVHGPSGGKLTEASLDAASFQAALKSAASHGKLYGHAVVLKRGVLLARCRYDRVDRKGSPRVWHHRASKGIAKCVITPAGRKALAARKRRRSRQ